MPGPIDFVPLVQETIDSIRARLDSDANAGVDPPSGDFIDTTPGGFWFDMTQAFALEVSRLWDMAASEIPAATFPAFAWGDYLDEHAESQGLSRKPAVAATGVVRFVGTSGAVIALNTEVSTAPTGDDDEGISFLVTTSGVIGLGGSVDLPVAAAQSGSEGNVSASTISVLVSPNSDVASVTNPAAMLGGADVETDEDLRDRVLAKLSGASGAGNIADYERMALAYAGVGSVYVEPNWNGNGTVRVVVAAADQGAVSDAIKYGLQDQLDPPNFLTALTVGVTLPTGTLTVATTTGAAASGTVRVGTQDVAYTGKTGTTFTGCTGGTGAQAIGTRVAQGFGVGRGDAPIGHVVTVDSVASVAINVVAVVTHETGYSLTGAGGTIATTADITTALSRYINSLKPGDDVILYHVIAQFFRAIGVADVSGVTLNGSGANVAISALQTAKLGTVTLT